MTQATKAIEASIQEFFCDTSRSRAETKAGLEDIRDVCSGYIDALHDADSEEMDELRDQLDEDDE